MIRTRGIVVVTAAVAMLGGCGSDVRGETPSAGPDATVAEGPLAGLDGDTLCGMVELPLLERQFGEPFAGALGGVNPPEQDGSVVCSYQSQAFLDAEPADLADTRQVTTKVTPVPGEPTAQDALDAALTDNGEPVSYEPVDGLGEVAGYAGSDLDVGSGGSYLVAIIEADGAFVEVVTKADPEGTVRQLRPIAEELLPKVESELP
ncbi:hypothetical protein [Prauserella muralis]|uniref:Uncharacterized protein n=1 Tax=Prauserella muralis TaxID=588067 RepID=A0A2V4AH79_9PSEU|nr:hypothetical protein [Prauserella muralis]PXY19272.1 hypothetical protein BAY60_31335 [Prauserella muralis]